MDSGISGPINDDPGPSYRPDENSYAQQRIRTNLFNLGRSDPANRFVNHIPANNAANGQLQFGSTIAPMQRPTLPENATRGIVLTRFFDIFIK